MKNTEVKIIDVQYKDNEIAKEYLINLLINMIIENDVLEGDRDGADKC